MVAKCFNCEALLRVKEEQVPENGGGRIRCPKCGSEGSIRKSGNGNDPSVSFPNAVAPSTSQTFVENLEPTEEVQRLPKGSTQVKAGELTLPEDAFRGFRFPAEIDEMVNKAPSWSFRAKLITFLAVSVFVLMLFAALVNIILPGMPPKGIERVASPPEMSRH